MAREADIVRLFDETEQALGPITHLVNSAGIGRQLAGRRITTPAALADLFAVNVVGLMLCCREAAKPHVDQARRQRRRDRQRLVDGRHHRRPAGLVGLCREQGRGRFLHHGLRQATSPPRASGSNSIRPGMVLSRDDREAG